MENKLEACPLVIDEEDYLAQHGAHFNFGEPALHCNRSISERSWKSAVKRQSQKDNDLSQKREELRKEYAEKVNLGEIRPRTRIEKLLDVANGHEDLQATHAARRLLAKQNIKW